MRKLVLLVLLMVSVLAYARPDLARSVWYLVRGVEEPILDRGPAGLGLLTDYEIEKLDAMAPQQQALALLDYAVAGYDNAADLVAARYPTFLESIVFDDEMNQAVDRALQSTRLDARAAAMDVYLATQRMQRNSTEVFRLLDELADPALPVSRRRSLVWVLAFAGGRGIERRPIFDMLIDHLGHPDDSVRFWTANAMGYFGGREVIDPLLDTLASDPHIPTRERAACSLSSSGMLNVEERYLAVPGILDVVETNQDPQTVNWGYQALRHISGAQYPNSPAPWREGLVKLGILDDT